MKITTKACTWTLNATNLELNRRTRLRDIAFLTWASNEIHRNNQEMDPNWRKLRRKQHMNLTSKLSEIPKQSRKSDSSCQTINSRRNILDKSTNSAREDTQVVQTIPTSTSISKTWLASCIIKRQDNKKSLRIWTLSQNTKVTKEMRLNWMIPKSAHSNLDLWGIAPSRTCPSTAGGA